MRLYTPRKRSKKTVKSANAVKKENTTIKIKLIARAQNTALSKLHHVV